MTEPESRLDGVELKDINCPYCERGQLTYVLDMTPLGQGSGSQVECLGCGATWDDQFKAETAPGWGSK